MSEPSESQVNTKEHPDLYRRSIKGGYWVIGLRTAIMLLGFAKSIIIANFFFLENLGIIAVAAMMMEALSTFTQTGFDTALVQRKGNIHAYLNTAWTAGLIKGAVLFLVLFLCAPLLVLINVPEDKVEITIAVLRAMAFCFLIRGVQNIGAIFFQKELEFGKVFVMTLASSLTDIVLSVVFIYVFRSIWGVIAARILSEAVHCAGSYILSPYRPRLHFEIAKARELWKFGKWIYGQSILGYFLENGDQFFVWFQLGLPQLALYRAASHFSNMPTTYISNVITTVSFPAYSKIQDDIPRLREAYLKVLKVTAFLVIPVSFLIIVLGPDFVKIFLKEHLHPMTVALQILAIKGLLATTGSTRGPLFIAMGRPGVLWFLQWLRIIILALAIYPCTATWGIEGTAIAILLMSAMVNPVGFVLSCKLLRCPWMEIIKQSFLPLIASLLMTAGMLAMKSYVEQVTYTLFFVFAFSGIFIYAAAILMFDIALHYGYFQMLQEQIRMIQKTQR